MRMQNQKSMAGFTLIELMIAMVLSLLLAGAVITVFVNSSHAFNQDENVLRMQDDARFALRELAMEISMAGNYSELHLPDSVTQDAALAIGVDCGPPGEANWMFQATSTLTNESLSITAIDNATNAQVAAAHSCFAAGEVLEGTDVISIKRVAGAETPVTTAGAVYLRTNGTVGLLYQAPMPAAPTVVVTPPMDDWEYRPSIFFIRPFANTPDDGIPTLCRKVLRGVNLDMTTECLATGIENLQVEYGVDRTADGNPNVFLSSPTVADMQNVVSARIFLLARTSKIDTKYTNQKTFSLSNSPDYSPTDSFHRRMFSTTVSIQNIRSLNIMGN